MYQEIAARDGRAAPEEYVRHSFKGHIDESLAIDGIFLDTSFQRVLGVANLPVKVPIVLELLKSHSFSAFVEKTAGWAGSLLILGSSWEWGIKLLYKGDGIEELEVPQDIREYIFKKTAHSYAWAGLLNPKGEHVMDLRTPLPGPHFGVNLLMGNRMAHEHALQTTPKSVVDRLGRGSFRAHAATQVLATRWDMRQEENGFPANRQFYLVENHKKIFYSADPNDDNIDYATCFHSQNHTRIKYSTKCGLEIERIIFILPQMEGMPIATEVQQIRIRNLKEGARRIRLVYTGMFGAATPHAIFEDVLYSNVIMQSKILRDEDGSIAAVTPGYYPEQGKEDLRFHTMLIHGQEALSFPKEFCMNYNEFVGCGSLENPQGIYRLSNNLYRKGPGFFAVAGEVELAPLKEAVIDNFTGLVSKKINPAFNEDTLSSEIRNLVERFSREGETERILQEVKDFQEVYGGFIRVDSENPMLNTYFNRNLPFQVLYQTFVSRSFCQTQKGYREIGFREIQDIYASMYYFTGMGMGEFVKQLLKEWCSMVFEFGFAYHNFFWEGKEPGKWSDDALWLIQALYRYVNLTGDRSILDEECPIAGTHPLKKRTIYNTVKAILQYSGEISIGKHGMPLLDNADWNDCLKLDNDFIDGITKERLYRKQLEKGGKMGEPLESHYSESVMNAFLLRVAIDETVELAELKKDDEYGAKLKAISRKLHENIQTHAWKEDFFARVLFNRYENGEYEYLGAKGDKLSADPELDGSYFLNSFNWSILSRCATEKQIELMLDVIEAVLKTPYGIKLVSPTDLGKVAEDTATGHYFPGDRENGGVFKHACMMATAAMFKAAKEVEDKNLAVRLSGLAYWMTDLVLPYRTMDDPYVICGNPRFCTQYNNSDTGENIGPMLSGTSTWLTLTLLSAFGIDCTVKGIVLDPVLREEERILKLQVNTGKAVYNITINKPEGFYRVKDGNAKVMVDGVEIKGNKLPIFTGNKTHEVVMQLRDISA